MYQRLSPGERKRLREAILAGELPFDRLAQELGVSRSTVCRYRDKLIQEGLLDPDWSKHHPRRKGLPYWA